MTLVKNGKLEETWQDNVQLVTKKSSKNESLKMKYFAGVGWSGLVLWPVYYRGYICPMTGNWSYTIFSQIAYKISLRYVGFLTVVHP